MKCDFCGMCEATEIIGNPNSFDDGDKLTWDVCKMCKEVIALQQKLSFGAVIAESPHGREYGEKVMKDAQEALDKIAKDTGVPILNAKIEKNDDGSIDVLSVEFTGKGDKNED
jgi:hypothetical protein